MDRIGENYILKATMDEFDEYRMKKNMSDEMKYREKVKFQAQKHCISLLLYVGWVFLSSRINCSQNQWERCWYEITYCTLNVQSEKIFIKKNSIKTKVKYFLFLGGCSRSKCSRTSCQCCSLASSPSFTHTLFIFYSFATLHNYSLF